jgi:hypothetical protein
VPLLSLAKLLLFMRFTTPPSSSSTALFITCSSHTVAQPETKEELRSVARATKAMPGQRIIEMQRGLLPLLGYDADFGVSCLNKINQTFPNDRELYQKFQMYAAAAEFAGT